MFESAPEERLAGPLEGMYQSFASKHPGMTRKDFIELRNDAVSVHSVQAKDGPQVGGVLMEEGAVETNDELKELHEDVL